MTQKKYELRYLPKARQDLYEIIDHIAIRLQNPKSANQLLDKIEKAIMKRLDSPLAFEPYPTIRKRKQPYYRIYIDNYTIFYVVIDHTMEIRRILYSKRNLKQLL